MKLNKFNTVLSKLRLLLPIVALKYGHDQDSWQGSIVILHILGITLSLLDMADDSISTVLAIRFGPLSIGIHLTIWVSPFFQ